MAENHELIMGDVANEIPTFVVRYEDLRIDPARSLTDLFCFLLDVSSIDDTVVESRIRTVVKQDSKKGQVYTLKTDSKSLSRNNDMYSDNQMNKLKEILFDYNNFCGYAVDALKRQETGDYDEEGALDDDGDNTTAFFYYSKVAQNEEDLPIHKHLKGYTRHNEKVLENPGSTK